jgi:superfamily II DNA/RNA helicase
LTEQNEATATGGAETEHKPTAAPVEAVAERAAEDTVAAAPAEEAQPDAEDAAEDAVTAEDDADDDAPEEDEASPEDESDEDEDGPTEEDEALAEAAAKTTFADLGLSEPILRAVTEAGYLYPTPIQEQAIPVVLMGRDVLGCAQTGTGKTAGFTLPMLDILAGSRAKARMPRSLILEPTRELALQVAENFVKYGKHLNLNHALLIGGESMNDQRDVLEKGVDVLIATPGRLLDLFDRGRILLADCKVLVIDEADRMLDMGFIPDVEKIVSFLPKLRQTLFFSATMAPEIRRLADAFLQNPKEITVSAPATVATTITTGLVWVREHDKREALRRLLRAEEVQNALIFCNRKVDVDILYKSLKKHGFSVGALHGDLDQSQRFATLNRFKAGDVKLLVCSDVAARGLDIGGLSHVFNFDVPFHAEDYVHRIGRTGRAGRQGNAFTLCMPEEARSLAAIEKLTGKPIPRMEIDGLDPVTPEEIAEGAKARRGRGGRPERSGGRDARGRGERGAGRGGERERGGDRERGPRPERGPREGRRDGPRREERDPPRREEVAAVEAPREERRPRRDRDGLPDLPRENRRDEFRRERREDRDAGPTPRGFGDAVPAFMLVPIPRPRREANGGDPTEAEAA